MQPPRKHSRINLTELKAQIVRELGPERSKHYFYYLNRLVSLKLSKVEFEKLCFQVVGRENIPLHNQFIHSILKNACSAKLPPPTPDNECLKAPAEVGKEKETSNDKHMQNGSHALVAQASTSPGFFNGNMLPISPRKARTQLRDRRGGDQRSALARNGKNQSASPQSITAHSGNVILDNGALTQIDTQCPMQHYSLVSGKPEKENEVSVQNSGRFSIPKISPQGPVSVHSKDHSELSAERDWREMHARTPLQAPIGVSFCPVSIGGARIALSVPTSNKCVSATSFGCLFDSVMLRERMEQISTTQGLEGVSTESANMLNNGLDAYLKRIIGSCIGLVGARMGREPLKSSTNKQQSLTKLINGVRIGHRFQMPRSGRPSDVMHEDRHTFPISLQDYRAAMELNPQQLCEDCPLLLEKICIRSYDI